MNRALVGKTPVRQSQKRPYCRAIVVVLPNAAKPQPKMILLQTLSVVAALEF